MCVLQGQHCAGSLSVVESLQESSVDSHSALSVQFRAAETIKKGDFMAQTMLQYVFTPTSGADMPTLMGLIKESAELWRKHGAQVSVWSVQIGEVGNMVFACRFDSSARNAMTLCAYGADSSGVAEWYSPTAFVQSPVLPNSKRRNRAA